MTHPRSATLKELIPEDIFVGVSLILRCGERFLYGVRAPRQLDGRSVLELTGIGGALEARDATLWAAAVREAEEETAATVTMLPCPVTVVVRSRTDVEQVALKDEQPAAVVFRHYRTPAHEPWHPSHRGLACLIVYAASLAGRPWPAQELPYLMWLKAEHVLRTARDDVPITELLSTGAELVGGRPGSLPDDAWMRMTDSQEALALALEERTLSFYAALPHA